MGDITLGCLLGGYDRAQSFDVASTPPTADGDVGSWNLHPTGAHSYHLVGAHEAGGSAVHSSAQGIRLDVFSHGNTGERILAYAYMPDIAARGFPEVTTHPLRADLWARSRSAGESPFNPASGQFEAALRVEGAGQATWRIPEADALVHHRLEGAVPGSAGTEFVLSQPTRPSSAFSMLADDVLVQVDPITLHPGFAFQARAQLHRSQHRTRGGALHTYLWGRHGAWRVPLRFLADSHAALLNWWWANQFNLLFTLNSSDSERLRTVRIVNDTQPVGRRVAPYADLWEGTLELESLDAGSLVF